jgi:hypothetical protein
LKSTWHSLLSKPEITFTWLRNSQNAIEDEVNIENPAPYKPVQIPAGVPLNRILDNKAELYNPAIDKLMELFPNDG